MDVRRGVPKYYSTQLIKVRRVGIIEDYIANNYTVKMLCDKYKVNVTEVSYTLTLYFKKPDRNLTLSSKV